jgi:hypothetical protein
LRVLKGRVELLLEIWMFRGRYGRQRMLQFVLFMLFLLQGRLNTLMRIWHGCC